MRPWKLSSSATSFVFFGREARELQRRLVRLRAAVAEERAAESRRAHELLAEDALRGVVVEIRDVQQRRRRLAQRLHEARMLVPEDVHGDAAEEVPVRAAVGVVQARALAVARMERRARVRLHEERVLARFDRGGRFVMQQQGSFLRSSSDWTIDRARPT